MTLRQLRQEKGLTQAKCAEILGMPLRTYQSYESREKQGAVDKLKYKFICAELEKYGFVDEEHGILTVEKIKETCALLFEGLNVEYCYLFGSYAKGRANERSDVDLFIGGKLSGIEYFGLAEELRARLKKRVDLLDIRQVVNNGELLDEILRYGVRIYG